MAGFMAFNAQGFWTPEDDDVQKQVQSVVSADGALMKQARGIGMMTAARRGLGNSSIAIGAAQGAVLDKATAIGGQTAAQIAAKNLARLSAVEDFKKATTVTGMQESGANQRAQMQVDSAKDLQQGALSMQLQIANLEASNALKLQSGEIDFKTAQAEQERLNALKLQGNAQEFQGTQADKDRANQTANLTAELNSRGSISQNELDAAFARQTAQNEADTQRQTAAINSSEKVANTETQAKLTIASDDRAAQARQTALAATTQLATAQMQASAALMSNPDIPESARNSYATSIQAATEANIGLVEQITGQDLQWGNNGIAGGGSGGSGQPPGSPKQVVSTQPKGDGSTIVRYADGTESVVLGTVAP
jgi:hypothetical protein